MAMFEIEANGKTYEVEAPDMQSAAAAVGGQAPQKPAADMPSVLQQNPSMAIPGAGAAFFGASDAQLGDIYQKQFGDRFIRREPVHVGGNTVQQGGARSATGYRAPETYDVITYKDESGSEKQGYVNRPGLDWEDVSRAVIGSVPFMATGGAAGAATAGRGLLAKSLALGGSQAATSAAGDLAMIPMGSNQGIEGGKAAAYGAFGAAAPLVGRAVGNATGAVAEKLAPKDATLRGLSNRAVSRVEEAIQADGITPRSYQAKAWSIDPDMAVLGDMGQTLQDDLATLAGTPKASSRVASALKPRMSNAPGRIVDDITATMGPVENIPQKVKADRALFNSMARPHYLQFETSNIPITPELGSILKRADASGAVKKAQTLMEREGVDARYMTRFVDDPMSAITGKGKNVSTRAPHGRELDYIKRGIDDLAREAKPGSNEQRIYSNLARDLRNTVDEILSPGAPDKSPWAIGRGISGEGLEGQEAAELGSKTFSAKKDPFQVDSELAGMSAHGKSLYKASARNDLRQVMGRASSNFGPKGDSAARRALNNEFAQENLSQIVGRGNADRLMRRIEGENTMAETFDKAFGNSKTARMLESKKRWPTPTEGKFASEAGKKGPLGLATEYGLKLADVVLGGTLRKAEEKAAVDGARMLVAQGQSRDMLVSALFKHIEAKKLNRAQGVRFERIMNALLNSSRVPMVQGRDQYLPAN